MQGHHKTTLIGHLAAGFRRFHAKTRTALNRPKRELVVYRVEQACSSLEGASQQFQSTLDQFTLVTQSESNALIQTYRRFKLELDQSQAAAQQVTNRIVAMEEAADALFEEWRIELEQFASRSLRSNSRQKLKATQQHYKRLLKALRQAETRAKPVLAAFNDQVLFLKHNLNALAITSLQHEMQGVGIDIAALIGAMENSIAEASEFVNLLADDKALAAPVGS